MGRLINCILITALAALAPFAHAQSSTALLVMTSAMIMSSSESEHDPGQAIPLESDGFVEIDKKQWSNKALDSNSGRLRYCGGYFLTVNGKDRCRKPKQGFWNSVLNINRDAPSVPLDDHLTLQMPEHAEVLEAREYRNGTLRIYYGLSENSSELPSE